MTSVKYFNHELYVNQILHHKVYVYKRNTHPGRGVSPVEGGLEGVRLALAYLDRARKKRPMASNSPKNPLTAPAAASGRVNR